MATARVITDGEIDGITGELAIQRCRLLTLQLQEDSQIAEILKARHKLVKANNVLAAAQRRYEKVTTMLAIESEDDNGSSDR